MAFDWSETARRNPLYLIWHIRTYVLEMYRQADAATELLKPLYNAVHRHDGNTAFLLMSNLLEHLTNAYHVAWYAKQKQNNTIRRRWVRVALRVSAKTSEEFRTCSRNAFIHFDDRLDQFFDRKGEPTAEQAGAKAARKYERIPGAEKTYAAIDRFDPDFGQICETYFEIVNSKGVLVGERKDILLFVAGEEYLFNELTRFGTLLRSRSADFLDGYAGLDETAFIDTVRAVEGDINAAEEIVEAEAAARPRKDDFLGLMGL